MSIPKPITEARGGGALIGQAGSLIYPWTNHRGHLGRTLPLEELDIVPLPKCSYLAAVLPSHPQGAESVSTPDLVVAETPRTWTE